MEQTNYENETESQTEQLKGFGHETTVVKSNKSTVCIHQNHLDFVVDEYVGMLKWNSEPTTTKTFKGYENFCIIVMKDGKCINQILSGNATSIFRFYDVYKLKSASEDRYKGINSLTVTLEMI
jgi:hypothetical protein